VVVRVGVRELRENLRSWLDRVKAGDEIVVTERGKPVAKLEALETPKTRLEELIELGIVRPARGPKLRIEVSSLPELETGPNLTDVLLEQRGR
jgi:prevent-host-death family protein